MYDQTNLSENIADSLFESPISQEEMLTLLGSENVEQRILAARAFCEIKDSRAIPLLLEMLDHTCALERVSAIYALGHNSNSQTVAALISKLTNDWSGYVR